MLRGRDFRIDETQENIEVFRPFELEMKLDTRMCRISFGMDPDTGGRWAEGLVKAPPKRPARGEDNAMRSFRQEA